MAAVVGLLGWGLGLARTSSYRVKSQTKRALKFGDYPFTTGITKSSRAEAIALAVRHHNS